jgi:pimeloyl-ACP methyl ester carboxylesterase
VDEGVRLEVLDWGGSGRAVVLLAGSGNTAHVFDGFAEKLTGYHVYGITRRGYGLSSRPDTGFAAQRMADDVLAVLDALKLVAPVLVGHSYAGQEMTTLAGKHSDRIAGLVYLDAWADPTIDYSIGQEARKKLPAAMKMAGPTAADYKSFPAYRDWQMRSMGIAFPESELRNGYDAKPDGSMGPYRTPQTVRAAMGAGMVKPDYSPIRVPVLAFFEFPPPVEDQMRKYHLDEEARAAVENNYAVELAYSRDSVRDIQRGQPDARVIELPGANHYVFLSNEADVLREMRAFLIGLAGGVNY